MTTTTDPIDTPELSMSLFEPLVGSTFDVSTGSDVFVTLILSNVTALPTYRGGSGRQSFSILFTGPTESPLRQRTYEFSHAQIGTIPIFIVPVSANAETYTYEAIFT